MACGQANLRLETIRMRYSDNCMSTCECDQSDLDIDSPLVSAVALEGRAEPTQRDARNLQRVEEVCLSIMSSLRRYQHRAFLSQ